MSDEWEGQCLEVASLPYSVMRVASSHRKNQKSVFSSVNGVRVGLEWHATEETISVKFSLVQNCADSTP